MYNVLKLLLVIDRLRVLSVNRELLDALRDRGHETRDGLAKRQSEM